MAPDKAYREAEKRSKISLASKEDKTRFFTQRLRIKGNCSAEQLQELCIFGYPPACDYLHQQFTYGKLGNFLNHVTTREKALLWGFIVCKQIINLWTETFIPTKPSSEAAALQKDLVEILSQPRLALILNESYLTKPTIRKLDRIHIIVGMLNSLLDITQDQVKSLLGLWKNGEAGVEALRAIILLQRAFATRWRRKVNQDDRECVNLLILSYEAAVNALMLKHNQTRELTQELLNEQVCQSMFEKLLQ